MSLSLAGKIRKNLDPVPKLPIFKNPTNLTRQSVCHPPQPDATLPLLTRHLAPATPRFLMQNYAVRTLMEFMDGHFDPSRARYSCESPFPLQPVHPPHFPADMATSSTRKVDSASQRVREEHCSRHQFLQRGRWSSRLRRQHACPRQLLACHQLGQAVDSGWTQQQHDHQRQRRRNCLQSYGLPATS